MNKQLVFLVIVYSTGVTHTMHYGRRATKVAAIPTDYRRFTRDKFSFALELVGKAAEKRYCSLHEALHWQQRHVVTISSYVFFNDIDSVIADINQVLLRVVYIKLNEFDRALYSDLQNLRQRLCQLRETVKSYWP